MCWSVGALEALVKEGKQSKEGVNFECCSVVMMECWSVGVLE